MSSVSGSFEDFIEQFKKRHAKDFAGIAGKSSSYRESREDSFGQKHGELKAFSGVPDGSEQIMPGSTETRSLPLNQAVKAPMVKVEAKKAPGPVSVAQEVDRKSSAAGDDWAEIADNWDGEAEVEEE